MLRSALAIGLLLQGPPTVRDGYSIASVSSKISPDASVGSFGIGLTCRRHGTLLWRDLAKSDPTAWGDAGQRALADVGQVSGRYRVSLTIRAIKMKLCLAWLGIGPKTHVKGTMTVDVAVRDEAAKTDFPVREMTVDLDMRGRDPRADESVLTQAVSDAVRTFVKTQPTA